MGIYEKAIIGALSGNNKPLKQIVRSLQPTKTTALMSKRERRYAAYKRQVRDDMVGGSWRDLDLKKRAMFSAKYVWDPEKGKYGKYVRRRPALKVGEVYKRMLRQSKRMARMGKRIGKKGARMRQKYSSMSALDAEGL